MPTTTEWALGFAVAATLLEGYFIGADRHGLLFVRSAFHLETLNMRGGCLLMVHNPLVELIELGYCWQVCSGCCGVFLG
jgi:hypothetical protein